MSRHIWALSGLVCLAVLSGVECGVIVKRQIQADTSIDPSLQDIAFEGSEDDRDKRAISQVAGTKFAVSNALLGFVFNPSKGIASKLSAISTTKRPTTTEDAVIFEKNRPVSLEVPAKLFGSTFTLITNLSTTASDYMINSALRLQRLLEVFRPALRSAFGAKGIVIEATTDKPIFSDNSVTR